MKGVVSSGSEAASEAGIYAFKKGGNAVDALISAQLSACVSEPLLTGLAGAGLAMIKFGDEVKLLDCFTTFPKKRSGRECRSVSVIFGEVSQLFKTGWGSASVPGMPRGIAELHKKFGSLPLKVLAEPAISFSKNGVPITKAMAKILSLLSPIYEKSKYLSSILQKNGKHLNYNDILYSPLAVNDIKEFVNDPWGFLISGHYGKQRNSIDGALSFQSSDLVNYKPMWKKPLKLVKGNATIFLPPSPSVGGKMLEAVLERSELPPKNMDIYQIIDALLSIDTTPRELVNREVFKSNMSVKENAGFTTHISVTDQNGNIASMTSSLGESCGEVIPGTGVILNNFLGEEDVCPDFIHQENPTGSRLLTMCTPSIVQTENRIFTMGAGGSSRIRSAIFHGIHQTISEKDISDIVCSSRIHCEGQSIYIETMDMPESEITKLKSIYPDALLFSDYGIFFGGLNMSGLDKGTLVGASDPRRNGVTKSYL